MPGGLSQCRDVHSGGRRMRRTADAVGISGRTGESFFGSLGQVWQTRQISFFRRVVVLAGVRPFAVVPVDVLVNVGPSFAHTGVGPQVHPFVFDCAPNPRDENVIPPVPLAYGAFGARVLGWLPWSVLTMSGMRWRVSASWIAPMPGPSRPGQETRSSTYPAVQKSRATSQGRCRDAVLRLRRGQSASSLHSARTTVSTCEVLMR